METTFKPALTAQEIMEIAERYCQKYLAHGASPDDVDECKGEMVLGMVEAASKAEAGKAIRALQWSYGINRVKTWWRNRYAEVAPADLDSLPVVVEHKENPETDRDAALCVSMDSGEVGATFADMLPANTPTPVDDLEPESREVQVMRVCLSRLPEHLADVLRWRYLEDKTLEEIGENLKTTREAVRQQEVKALSEMRRLMNVALVA